MPRNYPWAVKAKNGGKFPVAKKAASTERKKTFGKKGETRVIVAKTARNYPTGKVVKRLHRNKQNTPKIRESLKVGTVAIVLSGKFRGKRVVVVKRLISGLVLVSGPFKVNGVPLRRYNPAYLIATSTSIDLQGVELPANLKDSYFERPANASDKSGNKENSKVTEERIQLQKSVDSQLLSKIKKTPALRDYLGSRFSLSKGQAPHLLKF